MDQQEAEKQAEIKAAFDRERQKDEQEKLQK